MLVLRKHPNDVSLVVGRRRFSLLRSAGAPWLLELLLLFALVLLVQIALPGNTRLAAIEPHPFWLPVLLLATQYGIVGGLAAALSAIAISFVIGFPVQAGAEDFYDYSLRIWREPILWLGAAIILGGLRAQHVGNFAELHDRFVNANNQRQAIAEYCNVLKSHCESLERQMACSQDRSIDTGLAALSSLAKASPACAHEQLAGAIDQLLGPATYSVLIRRDRKFVENSKFGGGAGVLRMPPELEAAMLRGSRVLSVLREDDAAVLAGAALFAVPILAPGSERVRGLLMIEKMDAARIGEHVETILLAIAAALSQLLEAGQVVVNFDSMAGQVSSGVSMADRDGASRRRGGERARSAEQG